MKLFIPLSAFLVSAAAAVSIEVKVDYGGHKVFRVPVVDDVDRVNLVASQLDLQAWRPASAGSTAHFAVRPDKVDAFNKALGDLKPTVMHHDLGASIARESSFDANSGARSDGDSWFSSYHAWPDHSSFLQDLEKQYPDHAKTEAIGLTFMGHVIPGLHLYGKDGAGHHPAIVMHGTVHAREWITAMVVEYVAHTLLAGYGSDANLTRYLDQFDFYLIPIVNIDGFVYSRNKDRMWRKNRQKNPGSSCVGRDINRNWAFKWDVPRGASKNPCHETYRGQKAGDTPEVKTLAAQMHKIQESQGIKMFLDFHSYSQMFMTPYAWSCEVVPENNDEYQSLVNGTVAAIKAVHGTSFAAGPICPTIYLTSGNSVDYVADVVKADYAFSIELRDEGKYGFILPPEQILPSSEEAFAGLRYLMDHVK
ncbi:Metallocarboxypeptidase A [Escovopsis weberi]|uniref:Carboxypeptidase M14A n=1 Tax=Escovopsis weberi TaxID=150374 RepID=A0A0M9VUM1_ESCWE|nr:Metallocarboxypeptidase A [Escovopsis weberi]